MAELKIEGFLKTIAATESVGTSGFEKRDFVITTDEQYPQTLQFQLTQGKVNDIDQYTVGEKMSVSFNLRGREWVNPQGETKVFNTLQAWQLAHVTGAAPAPAPVTTSAPPPPTSALPAAAKSPTQIEAERIGYVHTNTEFTLDQMVANKWTFDLLIAHGHGKIEHDLPF